MSCHSPKWSCRSERRCLVITGAAPCVLRRGLTPAARLLLRLLRAAILTHTDLVGADLGLPPLLAFVLVFADGLLAGDVHLRALDEQAAVGPHFSECAPDADPVPDGRADLLPVALVVFAGLAVREAEVQDRGAVLGESHFGVSSECAGGLD